MRNPALTQPNVTLLLDLEGVIREATLAGDGSDRSVDGWIGRPWAETVAEVGIDKVRQMVEEACKTGVSVYHQVEQKFPDGREVLIEYTTVRLGRKRGLVAVGKSLRTVTDLEERLIAAQQAMEREYWKVHQVETRYRPLLAGSEPVLLLRGPDLHIVDASPDAIAALFRSGIEPAACVGRPFLSEVAAEDHITVRSALQRVQEFGRAPRFLAHLGRDRSPWLVRASLMASEPTPTYVLQLSPAKSVAAAAALRVVSVEDIVEVIPDGFAIVDKSGQLLRCNSAFLELIQVGALAEAVGQSIGRWLARPGADFAVLLSRVRKHARVKLFETAITGELGVNTLVEISAASDTEKDPRHIGLLIRDVSRRLPAQGGARYLNRVLSEVDNRVGKTPLRDMVKVTIGAVERLCIQEALERTGGNRTATAELLGLSRQSLYTKIDLYGLDGDSKADRRTPG